MLDEATFYYMLFCWVVFAFAFFFRKRPGQRQPRKQDRSSLLAMALSGVGFAIVWSVRRPIFSGLFPSAPWTDVPFATMTIGVGTVSVWFVLSGIRTLGKHWSLAAQLIDDHHLVTEGPYAIVRHPIYTGMLGMMLATGLAVSSWPWVPVAMVFGWYGTHLRIRSEERLLEEAFGEEFKEYARWVPALIPRLSWSHQ